jgi:hypothetical protein
MRKTVLLFVLVLLIAVIAAIPALAVGRLTLQKVDHSKIETKPGV